MLVYILLLQIFSAYLLRFRLRLQLLHVVITFCLILFASFSVYGQTVQLRGVITDNSDGQPVEGANVILRDAMVEMGVEAAETVMIGDTTFDMMMAGAAGAKAIGVAWGYHDVHELVAYGAHEIVSSYGPLPATVARLIEPVEPVPGCPGPADVMV